MKKLAVICASLMVALAATAQSGKFEAGFARVDITPEAGCQIPGGFSKNISKGVRDPLYVEACVLSDGTTSLALAAVDALFTPDDIVADARAQIEKRCGIPAANVMIAASHTHSGGPTTDCLGSERNPEYCRTVAAAIAEAVEIASRNAVEAQLGTGVGQERSVSFNRRFKMKDGTERTHPGRMNPDIVEPAGPMDPEVAVIAVKDTNGELMGCIVNHALHATVVGGNLFSADWPGYMRRTIRGAVGSDIGVIFLNGACGDVTQVNNQDPGPREFGEEWGSRIGTILGAEATKVLARMEYSADVPLDVTTELLDLPIRDLAESDEALVARETPASGLGASQNEAYLREAAMVRQMKAQSPTFRVEVQAMRIGNAAIVTNPTEYFCALGLDIKKDSPWQPALIATMANGYAGYVPTREAFSGGGYEIRTARSSFLAPGTGETIVEASKSLLNRLKK